MKQIVPEFRRHRTETPREDSRSRSKKRISLSKTNYLERENQKLENEIELLKRKMQKLKQEKSNLSDTAEEEKRNAEKYKKEIIGLEEEIRKMKSIIIETQINFNWILSSIFTLIMLYWEAYSGWSLLTIYLVYYFYHKYGISGCVGVIFASLMFLTYIDHLMRERVRQHNQDKILQFGWNVFRKVAGI